MKKLFLSFCFLLSMNSFAGIFLTCNSSDQDAKDLGWGTGDHRIIAGQLRLDCKDKRGDWYSIDIQGIGPGIEIVKSAVIGIACPLVSKKKLDNRGSLSFLGGNVSATVLVGATLGAGINIRGGFCAIGGLNTNGFGASAEVGLLKIMKGTLKSNNLERPEEVNL